MDLESLWTTLDERLLPVLRGYRKQLPTLDVSVKADKTLLSEADLAAQQLIVESILEVFPDSGFIAEEDDQPLSRQGTPMWVIDPIDGTSQFVDPLGREYCSVVCRLDEDGPTGAYVLAPELGADGSPISIHWSAGHVTVNGKPAVALPRRSTPRRASVTRSKNSEPRPYESTLERIGSEMKLRTTSQTVDMIRSCLDLSEWTGTSDSQFDLFYRRDQKLWDGAAGIGLSGAMGRLARTGTDEALFPVTTEFLAQREPMFAETVTGDPESVRWFLNLLRTEAAGGRVMRHASRMVLDVTSFISAEEFIVSQNQGVAALDPFARQSVEMNETERELVRDVASVADAAIGLPIVSPMLIGGRALSQKFAAHGNAYQKFVYREFVGA